MNTTIDQQFVEYIVKSLVGNPDAVSIERTIDEKGVLLQLTVDPEDLGRVIGKRGAGAQALRTLLRALGTKNDARYNLKIVDVNGGDRPSHYDRDHVHEDSPKDQSKENSVPEEEQKSESSEPEVRDQEENQEDQAQSSEEPETIGFTGDKDEEPRQESSSMADKTRKELADLDDLDI